MIGMQEGVILKIKITLAFRKDNDGELLIFRVHVENENSGGADFQRVVELMS